MANYPKYKPLICPRCGETRPTMKGMHWHLVCEHGLTNEDAYEEAGQADSESDGE